MTFRKKVFWVAILGGSLYLLMNYHFIFFGKDVRFLKKGEATLEYTFFSTHGLSNEKIVAIDALREDGVADLLVEMGRLTETARDALLRRYGD